MFFCAKKVQTLITTILFQAGLNIFLFWSNRKKNSDDFYLIVLMALFLIHTGFKYLLWLISPDYNTFNKIHGCFALLTGPYLLFYLKAVLGVPVSSATRVCHSIPFLLALVINVITLVDVLGFKDMSHLEDFHQIMLLLVLIPTFCYGYYIFTRLKHVSAENDIILSYKIRMIRIIALFLLLPSMVFMFNIVVPLPQYMDRRMWYVAMIVVMALILNYRFKISEIHKSDGAEPEKTDLKKYQHSSLSKEKMEHIVQEIVTLMNTAKPYLNPDFSLEDMAEMTSIPRHHITEGLNSSLQINFYKFVNQFRVEESKRLMRKMSPDQNLISIGFESGFKSKSTFNKYFKELTGSSPSEYLRSAHEVLA